jgi:hypothetical protein
MFLKLHIFLFWRLNLKYSVFTVGYPRLLKPLTTFVILIVCKKFLMRDPCVIFYGLIRMIAVVGVSLLEVLDTLLARTYLSSLTIPIIWSWLLELTSRLWKDITGVMIKRWLLYSVRLIIVIAVGTWHPSLKLMIAKDTHSFSLSQHQGGESQM